MSSVRGRQESSSDNSEDERDIELDILRGASRLVSHKYSSDRANTALVSNVLHQLPGLSSALFELPANSFEDTPSAVPVSIQPDVNDWVANIDAIMASYQQQDYLDMPTAGLAAEAGSFVSLAPEAFAPPSLDAHIHPTGLPNDPIAAWDMYASNDLSDDLVDLSW